MRERGLIDEAGPNVHQRHSYVARGGGSAGYRVGLARETIPGSMDGATRSIKQKIFSNPGSS